MTKSELREKLFEIIPKQLFTLKDNFKFCIAGGSIRDIVDGKNCKDIDLFFPDKDQWEDFCKHLNENGLAKEIEFLPIGVSNKTFNVRKFSMEGMCLDVIYYPFAFKLEQVVESFDFSINMLWSDLTDVYGSRKYDAEEIIRQIEEKETFVGEDMWFKASFKRACDRWDRFINQEGYSVNEEEKKKYQNYLQYLYEIHQVKQRGSKRKTAR